MSGSPTSSPAPVASTTNSACPTARNWRSSTAHTPSMASGPSPSWIAISNLRPRPLQQEAVSMHWLIVRLLIFVLCCALTIMLPIQGRAQNARKFLPGFHKSPWFEEQVAEERTPEGIRIVFNAPSEARFDPARPTHLIIYATPNGNTIEQTLGSAMEQGTDWHFDIQHIAAQTRKLREVDPDENIVLACVEAEGRSWPAWRQKHPDNAALIRAVVEGAIKRIPGAPVRVT